jgi:hypothetical protein
VSHEPYPRTDRTTPGSTPAEGPGAMSKLERQRAETEEGLPGQPTADALHDREEGSDHDRTDPEGARDGETRAATSGAASGRDIEVPPTETVPDEVAERAARSLDPRTGPRREPGEDRSEEDPMRPATSAEDVPGMPRGSEQ